MPCAVACSRADDDRAGRRRTRTAAAPPAARPPARPACARARPRTPASPRPTAGRSRTRPAPTPGSRPGRSRPDPPLDPLRGGQRRARVGHQQRLVAVDPAGVPAVVGGDPVGVLLAGAVGQPPGQPRCRGPDAQRLVQVLDPQAGAGRRHSTHRGRGAEVAGAAADGRGRRPGLDGPAAADVPVPQGPGVRRRPARRRPRPASAVTTAKPASQRTGRATARAGTRGVDLHDLLARAGRRCCAAGPWPSSPSPRRPPRSTRTPTSCSRGRGRTSTPARCRRAR